ncbi:MAG: tRNA-dihydrouridine synthase [Salinivirgaceae bacterium]|nr:tRNA-dihydrouridine synthase [Salinivirgaceae bacterium]
MSGKTVQLAPMLGLIDIPFIKFLSKIGGFDEMFLPYMLADEKSLAHRRVLRQRLAGIDNREIIVPQLLSNSAVGFVHFANEFYELGCQKVNWNMGCPQPFVTERNRGAAMLRDLENTKALLEAVLPKLNPKLSVKIRLGYNSADEFPAIVEMFNCFEISELIVHTRTAVQQYSGYADRTTFIAEASKSKNEVVYNGDIFSVSDVQDIQLPNLKGYMIGRGAIANPFIGLQIKGAECGDRQARFREFCLDIQNWYFERGTRGSFNRLKELWKYFSKAFKLENEVFAQLREVEDKQAFEQAVDRIFAEYEMVF